MDKNEEKILFNIPTNYADGIVVAGKVIPVRFFTQALIVSAIPAMTVFRLYHSDSLTGRISVSISVFLSIFIIAASGIMGNAVFDFVVILFRFLRKKRICLYNPRVKREEQPAISMSRQAGMISRLGFADIIAEKSATPKTEDHMEELFFEEDKNIREIPPEYMNALQLLSFRLRKQKKRKEVRLYEE